MRCLIPAAVFTAVLAVVCAVAASAVAQGSEKVYTPAKAAVVDGENTDLSRMLIHGIAEVEYIKRLLVFESRSAEDAMAGLESGEYAAVIELPEDFLDDIFFGNEQRGRIILSSAAASNSDVIRGIASFGELLMASGQCAAFGSQAVIDRYVSDWETAGKLLDRVNMSLLSAVLSANGGYFTLTVTDYAGSGVSVTAHYAMSWLAALITLSAVMFERLYISDRNRSMLLRLRGAGVSDARFLVWKIVLPFLFLLLILLAVLGALVGAADVQWSTAALAAVVAAAAVPAVVAAALLIRLERGALALMVSTVLGLFLCGGIVPRQMLPSALLAVGDVTPLGISRGLLAPSFGGELSGVVVGGAVFWLLAGLSVPVLHLRRLRLKGGAK